MLESNPFSVGQKITRIHIDDYLAMTHRELLKIVSTAEPPMEKNGRYYLGEATLHGRRKQFSVWHKPGDCIWLNDWALDIHADTDCGGTMRGNACFNLIGEPLTLRRLINAAIIPLDEETKAKILYQEINDELGDDGVQLYDIESSHAVVAGHRLGIAERMRQAGL